MKNVIKCPHCGAEYMAAEIFLPDSLLGKPHDIVKDDNGKIKSFLGKDMNLSESYRCDYCNKKFAVQASIKFNADSKTKDFDNKYKTKLTKPGLFLNED